MTTQMWRRLLAGVVGAILGLNIVSAVLHWATICSSLREKFHLEHPIGRASLVVGYVGGCAAFGRWWLPHMLNPAKRPTNTSHRGEEP